ncbi:MAG: hypothetical protein GDA51_02060 [Ekhidna sp.]|nr:hypothetical protein [Ekhidna sp.]
MKNAKKSKKKDSFKEDYQKIMQSSERSSFVVPVQWTNEGDSIEKFSLYENYTPVKTSGDTTMFV